LVALVDKLQQQNLELAGRIGYYQAETEQLRTRLAALEAPVEELNIVDALLARFRARHGGHCTSGGCSGKVGLALPDASDRSSPARASGGCWDPRPDVVMASYARMMTSFPTP
jgi:hypothetical protein